MSEEDPSSSYSSQTELPQPSSCSLRKCIRIGVFLTEVAILVCLITYFDLCYSDIPELGRIWFGGYIGGTMLTMAAVGVAKYWNKKHCNCIVLAAEVMCLVFGVVLWISWTIFGLYLTIDSISNDFWAKIAAAVIFYQFVRFATWMIYKK